MGEETVAQLPSSRFLAPSSEVSGSGSYWRLAFGLGGLVISCMAILMFLYFESLSNIV